MSNVISFAGASGHRQGSDRLKPEEKKATLLRDAFKAGVSFDWADQQRAARQFDELLIDLKKTKAVSPADVARKAGLGGNNATDSSKRLHTYRLPVDADARRKSLIAKKPDRYFNLARAVAELTGNTEETILARIFEGCSFGSTAAPVPDWDTERWEVLADLLEAMSRAIVIDTDLAAYYRDLLQTQVRYSVFDGTFDSGPGVSDTHGISGGLAGNPIYVGEAPPVPSVSIARELLATPYDGEVETVEGDVLWIRFEVYLDVRLALGPMAGGKKVGPLLEFRSLFECGIGSDEARRANYAVPYLRGHSDRGFSIDGENLKLIGMPEFLEIRHSKGYREGGSSGVVNIFDIAEYREDTDHAYFNWYEISPALLREVLSPPSMSVEIRPSTWAEPADRGDLPSRFEQFSTADLLYSALLDGRLEAALREQCEYLTSGFRGYRAALREQMLEIESQARAGWRRPVSEAKCHIPAGSMAAS